MMPAPFRFSNFSLEWTNKTVKPVVALAVVLICFMTAGCASSAYREQDKLYQASQFAALAVHMERQVETPSGTSTSNLFYLCEAYAKLKKYNKLFPCLEQMERNIEKGDKTHVFVEMGWMITKNDISYYPSLARATAYIELGSFSEAVRQGVQGYDSANNLEPTQFVLMPTGQTGVDPISAAVTTTGTLALAYALAGDRENAQKFTKILEDIDIPSSGKGFRQEKKAIALAKAYMALGDFERAREAAAETFLARSNEFVSPVLGVQLTKVHALHRRFILYKSSYETGHVKEARKGFDELLALPETQTNGEIYWMTLYDRGRIAEGEGQAQQAIEHWTRAIEVLEEQRSTINTEASKIGFVGDKQEVYHRLVAVLIKEGKVAQAFEYVERAKARALVDLLGSKHDFSAPGQQPSMRVTSLVKDWDQVQEELRVPVQSPEEAGRRSARGVQVRMNIRAASPELASLVMVNETASSAIQALLELDETLLEYYYQGDDLYAFGVTRDRIQGIKLNGTNLLKEVEAFRKALQDPKSGDIGELSRKLYGRLVHPVSAQMNTKRLLIVGHGVLHYLPFAALTDGTEYLVDRYSFRLMPSASVLQFLKGRPAQKGSLLAFGNPDLGDAKYDLKFAQDEVQTIAKAFPDAKVLVRKEATKSALKSLGPKFTYLHFATHGKFDPNAPMKSGLLLAEEGQQDGFLSLGELYSLRLNADLVTLSACETGLGKVNNGDDVVGLTRGFLYAGSSSIVASLWEVDDLATSLLMTEFYMNLKKTDKQEALRQAQLATRQRYAHPYYWSAFQLTGMP